MPEKIPEAQFPPPYIKDKPNLFRDADTDIRINGKELSINEVKEMADLTAWEIGRICNIPLDSAQVVRGRAISQVLYWERYSWFAKLGRGEVAWQRAGKL